MAVLGQAPEIKQFRNGGSITNFSIATTEQWKDKTTGECKELTEWHKNHHQQPIKLESSI